MELATFDEGKGEVDEVGVGVGDGFEGGGVAAEREQGGVLLEEGADVDGVVLVAGMEEPGGVELFLLDVGEADGVDGLRPYCSPGMAVMV